MEFLDLEGTFRGHLVQFLCNEQGHIQLNQVAQILALKVSRLIYETTDLVVLLQINRTQLFFFLLSFFFSLQFCHLK